METQRPATPTVAPDPTADAYRAVSAGDCLAVYDTGNGGYNTQVPYRVGCSAYNAYMWVNAVRSSSSACSQGPGQNYMSYTTSRGQTIALCLTRQFKVGYCLMAKQSGSGQSAQMRAGLMTVVECDGKVPARYNQILHITGVYKAPANPSASNCARVQGDRTYYWSWVVNGGRTLLCTMVYQR
ncbi:hypothetical protein SAZ11_23210 [Streptomyces sp. FXJ1.4098]|nr:hypothetical protein [Streptomyces sp. FXJ1.4098]